MKYFQHLPALFIVFFTSSVYAASLKDHLSLKDLINPSFECKDQDLRKYTAKEQKLIDILWNETIIYLQNLAQSLTTNTSHQCLNSDLATYETTKPGFSNMCITDNEDVRKMVKHITQITNNPDKAKACFSPRIDEKGLTTPSGELLKKSKVAQWINRPSMENYFESTTSNSQVKDFGKKFAQNFSKMVLGKQMQMPTSFKTDVSANKLPNLWASVGWVPMYAANSERNKRNFDKIRGGYAYAEILGHWGLLRINKINNEEVGAEVGMVVQQVDTFYPYHNHAISEMYYTIRQPACTNQFKTFAIRENNPLLTTVSESPKTRTVRLDTNFHNEHTTWAATEPKKDPLVYFHTNTIHAFEIDANCEAKPEEKAMVTVWARSNANNKHNDYGNTLLCESAEKPNTPAVRGEVIHCDLSITKW